MYHLCNMAPYPVGLALVSNSAQGKALMWSDLTHRIPEEVTELKTAGVVNSHECAIHHEEHGPALCIIRVIQLLPMLQSWHSMSILTGA